MNESSKHLSAFLPSQLANELEMLCAEFEEAWRKNSADPIERYLDRWNEDTGRSELFESLLIIELKHQIAAGRATEKSVYESRFPEEARTVARVFGIIANLGGAAGLPDETISIRMAEAESADGAGGTHRLPRRQAGGRPDQPVAGYELLNEIARGGMGVVYKARQLSLDRIVAVKMILSGQFAGTEDISRFRTEAQAAANLDHPGIVPVFEIGEAGDQYFYSMGFVDGHSLADELRDGPLQPKRAVEITHEVAAAISFAHQQGVIHRDLKPANVLIDSTGAPRVTDFGLAKRADNPSDMTGTGQILGTPAFMPPEQAAGRIGDVSPLSDVYSLGALLYSLLAGRPPFQAASPVDTILQVLEKEPIPLRKIDSSIPRDLETICARCLQKAPNRRYASAASLSDDLQRWLTGEPIHARPVARYERAWMWCKRKPIIASMAVAILLLATVGAASFWERLRSSRTHGIIEALVTAAPEETPPILRNLERHGWWARSQLDEAWSDQGISSHRRKRIGMAMLRYRPDDVRRYLVDLMHSTSDTQEFLLLRNELESHTTPLRSVLWAELDSCTKNDARFRRLVALAAFDPQSKAWATHANELAAGLLTSNSLELGRLTKALDPVSEWLIPPLLSIAKSEENDEHRRLATTILTRYSASSPDRLVDLALDATPTQFAILWPALKEYEGLRSSLSHAVSKDPRRESPVDITIANDSHQANALIMLFELGEHDAVFSQLRRTPEPNVRTYLINRLGDYTSDPQPLIERLEHEAEPPIQHALLLALGGVDFSRIAQVNLQRAIQTARSLTHANDPGARSAAEWLLRQWGIDDIPMAPATETFVEEQDWFVAADGNIMTIIPAGREYKRTRLFSNANGDLVKSTDTQQLKRTLAVASTKITLAQFRQFLHETATDGGQTSYSFAQPQPSDSNYPATQVTWIQAARYCRWLSEKAMIPPDQMCFPPIDEIVEGMTLPNDYLDRTGYRLPTQEEWECFSRGGTVTAFSFGADRSMLSNYSWHAQNSGRDLQPVATLRPNEFGLFDTMGLCMEWCTDIVYFSPMIRERVHRGTCRFDDERVVQLAPNNIGANRETYRGNECGMRIVRTLPPR